MKLSLRQNKDPKARVKEPKQLASWQDKQRVGIDMITRLDTVNWSSELYGGNAAFVDTGATLSPPGLGTIFVVSQVRPGDNTFVILRSNPVPPDPGPGFTFTQVASYTFPETNESFDPVAVYDGSRYIHIVGTQDNRTGYPGDVSLQQEFPVDLIKFTYDTQATLASPPDSPPQGLFGPTVLATAITVREGYDICPLSGGGSFVAAAVTNPLAVDLISTMVQVTGISISGNMLTVTAGNDFPPGISVTLSGLQLATFLNGVTVTVSTSNGLQFTAHYVHTPYSQVFSPPMYESGFAAWIPGNSLLGFALDATDTLVSPPAVLANSPLRGGTVFGSTSCVSVGSNVEVYYESHPDTVTFKDQTFNVIQVNASVNLSPPSITLSAPSTLFSFSGRYTDNRLTVVPFGASRTASLVYFTQDTLSTSIAGNIVIGYTSIISPPSWNWHINTGASLGGSVTQAVVSYPLTAGPSVTFLLAPKFNNRGEWSYSDPSDPPEWQDSFAVNDQVLYGGTGFTCTSPFFSKSWWIPTQHYIPGDIAAVAYYFRALHAVEADDSDNLPPPQDSDDWLHLGPGVTPPPGSVQPWRPLNNYLIGNIVEVPAYYLYIGIGGVSAASPVSDLSNWTPLLAPPSDPSHWTPTAVTTAMYTGTLDLASLGIISPDNRNPNLTWLRGTKSTVDDLSGWAIVGEAATPVLSPPYVEGTPYYVSGFDVPPQAVLTPLTGTILREVPFTFDASGTIDPDPNATIQYKWEVTPSDPAFVGLVTNGAFATLTIARSIGGAQTQFSVAVIPIDYHTNTPDHVPMNVLEVSYDFPSNTATLVVDTASLAAGEVVLAYDMHAAAFLNNALITVTSLGVSLSPPGFTFTGTVQFATPAQIMGMDFPLTTINGYAVAPPQYAKTTYDQLFVAFNAAPTITMPPSPTVPRNSSYTIIPVITGADDPDDLTTYTWTQTQGTIVQVSGADSPELTVSTNGAAIEGETLGWSLTVDDGVNPPVSAIIYVTVLSYLTFQDTETLSRSSFQTQIQVDGTTPDVLNIFTDYAIGGPVTGIYSIDLSGNPPTTGNLLVLGQVGPYNGTQDVVTPPTGFTSVFSEVSGGFSADIWIHTVLPGETMFTLSIGAGSSVHPLMLAEIQSGKVGTPYGQFGVMSGSNPYTSGIIDTPISSVVLFMDLDFMPSGFPVSPPQHSFSPPFYSLVDQGGVNAYDSQWGRAVGDAGSPPVGPIIDHLDNNGVGGNQSNPNPVYLTIIIPASNTSTLTSLAPVAGRNMGIVTLSPPLGNLWSPLDASGMRINLTNAKRTSVLFQAGSPPIYGNDRYLLISPYSVNVYLENQVSSSPPAGILRRFFLPSPTLTISPPVALSPPQVNDAVHTEDDYTLVLGNDGNLYRFASAPELNTDNPDTVVDLLGFSSMTFTKISSTVAFAGSRILVLSGQDGCLLLQVDSGTLQAQALLEISSSSQLLYGADNVQFVRLANVENIQTGKVFLGTIDGVGNTFETLVDLSQNRIIGTWNRSQLINQFVTSGEILFSPESTYSGRPLPPALAAPVDKGPNTLMAGFELVGLTWVQERPDLVNGYVVQSSIDSGATWQVATFVGSGSVQNVVLSSAKGFSYDFRVQANSNDGNSNFSNVESLSI